MNDEQVTRLIEKLNSIASVLGWIAIWLFFIALGTCSAANAAEIEAFALIDHTSDVRRGRPFSDSQETTQDYIAGGMTITLGRRRAFQIDVSHGFKTIDCRPSAGCRWETGSQISTRFYPGRVTWHR
jgi:hypothetical protein